MKTRFLLTTSLMAASLFALAPASANAAAASHQGDRHAAASTSQSVPAADELPPIAGPKRTIAVGKIDAIPGLAGPYAAAAGPGVAAMLATALDHSGRFLVAERDDLAQVLTEQEMVANRVSQGSAGPKAGAVIPAQYLIVGAVTELSAGDQGSNVGIGIGGLPHGLFGGLSLNGQTGRVAMDLRLVNTHTGQIEDSFSVRKELSSRGVGITGGYKAITIGGNQFWSTPLGEAMRAALDEAVARIAADVSKGGWDALVAQVSGDTIYINAGSDAGLKIGDHLVVERVSGALTDPATNRVLAVQKNSLANIELTAVDTKFATGKFVQTTAAEPQRGDTVVFAP
jgi:curli biogenesis system outer membrane secretion channel CsgG